MKYGAHAAAAGFCALLMAGCGSADPSDTAPAAQDPAGVATAPTIVFSESFADAGVFAIMQDADGRYGFSVQARIGSDAERVMGESSGRPTLAEVYRDIHGTEAMAPVPAIVEKVSEQLRIRTEVGDQAVRTLAKSDFSSAYCRDIREGGFIWRWRTCNWTGTLKVLTSTYANPGDRVYAWNNSPYTANLSLWNSDFTSASSWRPSLPPYTVSWFIWGGSYYHATVIMGKEDYAGEMGLSIHAPIPDVG